MLLAEYNIPATLWPSKYFQRTHAQMRLELPHIRADNAQKRSQLVDRSTCHGPGGRKSYLRKAAPRVEMRSCPLLCTLEDSHRCGMWPVACNNVRTEFPDMCCLCSTMLVHLA
mmetsp:Transcript_50342/g.119682  ORF Transcript_50342/g.119682 Transcript_50342/m.119682 type:complete len:113 (+) Transcript_50342:2467-2805(+)